MFKNSITPEEIEKLQLASFKGKIKVINRLGLDDFDDDDNEKER